MPAKWQYLNVSIYVNVSKQEKKYKYTVSIKYPLTMAYSVWKGRVLNGFLQKVQHGFEQRCPLRDALHTWNIVKQSLLFNHLFAAVYGIRPWLWVHSPALGALTVLLWARGSESVLEPVEVEGPGLLSMATSDTAFSTCITLENIS